MLAVDLFYGEACIRLCIRVTNPNVEKGRAFSGGSRPSDKGEGGAVSKTIFFGPLGLILVEKIREGLAPRAPPLDPRLALQLPPRAWMWSRASAALFLTGVSTFPFISWGAGSIWLSVHTIFRISIFCYNSVACYTRRYTCNLNRRQSRGSFRLDLHATTSVPCL